MHDIDGLVHDCSNSIANALDLLQSCTKPSLYLVRVACAHICQAYLSVTETNI